jgi:hypothetical protein
VVRAEGHAVWEGTLLVARHNDPITIRLQPGSRVSGRVATPSDARSPLRVTLVPHPREVLENITPEAGRDTATLETPVAPDGSFHFDHVRPDGYRILIQEGEITWLRRWIQIEDEDLDLGTFALPRTGRVTGVVHYPVWEEKGAGTPWEFADVQVISDTGYRRYLSADENGHFVIERVPEGLVTVAFPYQAAPDYGVAFQWSVQVVAGATTEIRAFDPEIDRSLTVPVVVGDGSRAQLDSESAHLAIKELEREPEERQALFALELTPSPGWIQSVSCFVPEGLPCEDLGRLVIGDVPPGRYRLRLFEVREPYAQARNLLHESELTIKRGTQLDRIVVPSSSITGRVEGGSWTHVIAIHQGGTQHPRSEGAAGGRFSIPYVGAGNYTLLAHDYENGWARLSSLQVGGGINDAGTLTLIPGGVVSGSIVARTPCPVPTAVVAVDSPALRSRIFTSATTTRL